MKKNRKVKINCVEELKKTILYLLPYILHLKKESIGAIKCEECGSKKGLSIYFNKPKPTYYDLKLLCKGCNEQII